MDLTEAPSSERRSPKNSPERLTTNGAFENASSNQPVDVQFEHEQHEQLERHEQLEHLEQNEHPDQHEHLKQPIVDHSNAEQAIADQSNAYTQFKLLHEPVCLAKFELNDRPNHFKGCKWSPDGSCLMTCSNDKVLRLFNLPSNFAQLPIDFDRPFELNVALQIKESGLVYDYCFNPNLNSADSSSCFLLTTSHGSPIHSFDAYYGRPLASYVAYTDTEEETFAHSLTINPVTNRIYAGYKNAIRFFDLNRPGRTSDLLETYYQKEGQSGLISCLSVNPANTDVFAAGSYSKQLGLYSASDMKQICVILGHQGGLTHMKFSWDGTKLFTGSRREHEIFCWDIRYLSEVLYSLRRDSDTNQRIYFDTNFYTNHLVSGGQDGRVRFYDLGEIASSIEQNSDGDSFSQSVSQSSRQPTFSFQAHQDCVNGVALHPFYPLLASCSGERKFAALNENDDEDCSFFGKHVEFENALKLWWLTDRAEYNRATTGESA